MLLALFLVLEVLEGTRLVLTVELFGITHFDDEDVLELPPIASLAEVALVSTDNLFLGAGRMLKR